MFWPFSKHRFGWYIETPRTITASREDMSAPIGTKRWHPFESRFHTDRGNRQLAPRSAPPVFLLRPLVVLLPFAPAPKTVDNQSMRTVLRALHLSLIGISLLSIDCPARDRRHSAIATSAPIRKNAAGAPRTLTLLLVNQADHGVAAAPHPLNNCEDGYDGWFEVFHDFKPLKGKPEAPRVASGCRLSDKAWAMAVDPGVSASKGSAAIREGG